MCQINKDAIPVYLAVPYSGIDHELSFRWANITTAYLIERVLGGPMVVFSPISHSHPVAKDAPYLENTHSVWLTQDYQHVANAEKVYVLKLKGWDKSFGVGFEIGVATALDIPVYYIEPLDVWRWHRRKALEYNDGVKK